MSVTLASAALPLLGLLDPERAHGLSIAALRSGLVGRTADPDPAGLRVHAFGKALSNPLGLAAGYDKNAAAAAALANLGFGFVEVGTITLRPQAGNPRPRVFRLRRDAAVVNALGFNNDGLDLALPRLAAARARVSVLGANVGPNRDSDAPERDYAALVSAVADRVDYVTINVSSPNTPGLRALQAPERLSGILGAIRAACPTPPPLMVKISPDMTDAEQELVVAACIAGGATGLIVGNTTLSRPATMHARTIAPGGLSGRPLFDLATRQLARASLQARGRLLLVGVGGVGSGREALTKVRAGATLVQLYTALIYRGPALIGRIKKEMAGLLDAEGATLRDLVGRDAGRLAG